MPRGRWTKKDERKARAIKKSCMLSRKRTGRTKFDCERIAAATTNRGRRSQSGLRGTPREHLSTGHGEFEQGHEHLLAAKGTRYCPARIEAAFAALESFHEAKGELYWTDDEGGRARAQDGINAARDLIRRCMGGAVFAADWSGEIPRGEDVG